jgi:hypothetical protein
MEIHDFIPEDRVECRHMEYFGCTGTAIESRNNRRFKEFLIKLDGSNEEVWISRSRLWKLKNILARLIFCKIKFFQKLTNDDFS